MGTDAGTNGTGNGTVTKVSFRVGARLANRSLAIGLVETIALQVDKTDRDFANAITTAFGEAFNNVVIHSDKNRNDGVLDVEAELGSDFVTLKLIDHGATADLSNVPTPDLDGLPEGGLGIFMMQSLMDEVVYRGGSPNVLSLTKRITAAGSPSQ